MHTVGVPWEVEFTSEFQLWWDSLSEGEQDDVAVSVRHLIELGPALGFPHSSRVVTLRHAQMRELRTQSGGRPLRTLYAFNPLRTAILPVGGDKTGDDRWYDVFVPVADKLLGRASKRTEKGRTTVMPTRNFRELLEGMTPARRRKIEKRVQDSLSAMPLDDLRRAREMTQLQLSGLLGVHQSEVSRIEHRSDICVSTLIGYIEALGGHVEIRAVFADREVLISQFEGANRQLR